MKRYSVKRNRIWISSICLQFFKKVSEDKEALNSFVNNEKISFIHYEKVKFVELSKAIFLTIPFKNSQLEVELLEVPDSFYNYEVVTNEGQRFPSNKQIKHYRGVVKNNPSSLVAISFLENEVIGLVATNEGNFNLVLDKKSGRHVFYNDINLERKMDFLCETHGHGITNYNSAVLSQPSKSTTHLENDCVRLYFETEHDIFQTRGSVTSVEIFVTAVYNQVATLYQNENIETSLSEIFVWTTADPYTLNDLEDLLEQFQSNRTSFNGDLGQLLTFRTGVGGGIAAGFEGICNSEISERLSVAMLHNDYETVPTYSWTVHIVAHEFGHLFGSRHTHACVWNGDNTAIDGCWWCMESPDPTEGTCDNCDQAEIPIGGGTIMSYCHLESVGVNFNLGFGLQPGNVIRNSVANANCLCECVNSTISGPDYLCSTNTFTLQNVPAGSTVTWSVSPGGLFSGDTLGSGSSAPLSPYHYLTSGQATITFMIETDCGEVPVHQSFWVGKPSTPGPIILGNTAPTVGSYEMYLLTSGLPPGATSMTWWLPYCFGCSDPWSIYSGQNLIQMVAIVGDSPGYVQAMGNNTCGNGPASLLYVVPDLGGGSCNPCPRIYPNPASEELFVEWRYEEALRALDETEEYEVALYDMQGARLFSGKSTSALLRLDLSKLRNGFYYIHILHKEGLIRKQIRVER